MYQCPVTLGEDHERVHRASDVVFVRGFEDDGVLVGEGSTGGDGGRGGRGDGTGELGAVLWEKKSTYENLIKSIRLFRIKNIIESA